MRHLLLLPLLLLQAMAALAQQVDPYHSSTGGFGYPVSSSAEATVWWAEGTYKIMQDMEAPQGKASGVRIWSARNEWESFQVVIRPDQELKGLEVSLSDFKSKKATLPSEAFSVRKVEYVQVKHPTDSYGKAGLWPDPLPTYFKPEDLAPGRNHPFWITVKVPKGTPAGV